MIIDPAGFGADQLIGALRSKLEDEEEHQRRDYPCSPGSGQRRLRGEEVSQDTRQQVALEVKVEAQAQPLLSAEGMSAGRYLVGTANPALRRLVVRHRGLIGDCSWPEGVSVIRSKKAGACNDSGVESVNLSRQRGSR